MNEQTSERGTFTCILLVHALTSHYHAFPIQHILMNLHTLSSAKGSRRNRKRIARGNSAGGGTTAGRGTKGQAARAGKGRRFGFEGGQTPLVRRQPKLGGFTNPTRKEYEVVNISLLEEKLPAGSYDQVALRKARLIRSKKPIKLLADGEVQKKFALTVDAASKKATEVVSKAGGTVTIAHV